MRKALFLTIAAIIATILFYISRFWFLSLWPRSGLLGIEALRPQGGLLARWLSGTDAAPFELIIWATFCFLALTWAQRGQDRLTRPKDTGEDHE